MVEVGRVLDDDEVEPAAAAGAARGDTDLVTDLAELLADLVELFCGEGTAADAGGVGLDDTDDVVDLAGVEAELEAVLVLCRTGYGWFCLHQ